MKTKQEENFEMIEILEELLASDVEITARAVIRSHPTLRAASSITRSDARMKLLHEYQERQKAYRRWRGRLAKRSIDDNVRMMSDKDRRIVELEANVKILTASHVAMYAR